VLRLSDLWLLNEAQMRGIEPYFPLSHGIPRVDDRRIVSGIIFVIRNGLRWRDAPTGYGSQAAHAGRHRASQQDGASDLGHVDE
jgi:transposase